MAVTEPAGRGAGAWTVIRRRALSMTFPPKGLRSDAVSWNGLVPKTLAGSAPRFTAGSVIAFNCAAVVSTPGTSM